MDRKTFTVEEANEALPFVRRAIGEVQERMAWLASNRPEVRLMVPTFRIPFEAPVPPAYFATLVRYNEALGEIGSLGCQVKDIRRGLVDFPSILSGKEVLLCWRAGEEKVGYYHEIDAGFAGRRPIPDTPDA